MAVPVGLSGSAAVSLVQNYASEFTFPSSSTILTFLNRGVEEVDRRIGGIRLWGQYFTVANQPIVQLDNDVLDVVSANFSLGNAAAGNSGNSSPQSQGSLVYPMTQLDQGQFFDAAAGFPVVGFGPPQAYFIYQDQGTNPTTQVPAPGTTPYPAQPVLSSVSGTSAGTQVFVKITYTDASGETTPSSNASFTPLTTQQISVGSPPSYTNANGYNIYASATSGGTYYLQNTSGAIALGTAYTVPGTILTSGTQAPSSNTTAGSGQGGSLSMQLYPACMIGQVNVYYRARPQLWADTTTTSWTNLDTSAQEAVVLFATIRVLMNRGRGSEARQIWTPEYEAMIESLTESIRRRTMQKSGQVRDVRNRSYPNTPYWLTG